MIKDRTSSSCVLTRSCSDQPDQVQRLARNLKSSLDIILCIGRITKVLIRRFAGWFWHLLLACNKVGFTGVEAHIIF